MIDPVTEWFEITQYKDKKDGGIKLSGNYVANQVSMDRRNHA